MPRSATPAEGTEQEWPTGTANDNSPEPGATTGLEPGSPLVVMLSFAFRVVDLTA